MGAGSGVAVVALLALVASPLAGASPWGSGTAPRPAGPASPGSPGPILNRSSPVEWNASLPIAPGIAASVSLSGNVSLPNGTLDAGTVLPAAFGLSVPSEAQFRLTVLGATTMVPIPALGQLGPLAIPGLNYTYLGASFRVYVALSTQISANCSSAPSVVGCAGPVNWSGPSDRPLQLDGVGLSPGEVIALTLSGLAYGLTLNLTARGSLPVIGNVTVPVAPPLRLAAFAGRPENFSSQIRITAPPTIASFVAAPDTISVGQSALLSVRVAGGSGPVSYRYFGVPTGCEGPNAPNFSCSPSAPATYTVSVEALDAQGLAAFANLSLSVTPAGARPAAASSSSGAWTGLALIAGIVAVAAGVTLLWRKRRRA